MNSIKKDLFLALSVAFCASFQVFAMEKEVKSNASRSREEQSLGIADTSSESEINEWIKQKLAKIIQKLETVSRMINQTLRDKDISIREHNELKQLQQDTHAVTIKARDMLFGIIPVNLQLIDQNVRAIITRWNQIDTSSESSSY